MAEVSMEMDAPVHHELDAETQEYNENLKFAVWLYLASEVVIFSILIAGYMIFRINNAEAASLVKEHLGIALVTANTFVLLASSYFMVMGLRAIELGDKKQFYGFFAATAALGIVFLGGQYIEYAELGHLQIGLQNAFTTTSSELFEGLAATEAEALRDTVGNFGMRFYAPTAFHGAHVLVGVLWALFVMWRGYRGYYDQNTIGVEIFGLYWHFVDVVWIVLFTLIYLI